VLVKVPCKAVLLEREVNIERSTSNSECPMCLNQFSFDMERSMLDVERSTFPTQPDPSQLCTCIQTTPQHLPQITAALLAEFPGRRHSGK